MGIIQKGWVEPIKPNHASYIAELHCSQSYLNEPLTCEYKYFFFQLSLACSIQDGEDTVHIERCSNDEFGCSVGPLNYDDKMQAYFCVDHRKALFGEGDSLNVHEMDTVNKTSGRSTGGKSINEEDDASEKSSSEVEKKKYEMTNAYREEVPQSKFVTLSEADKKIARDTTGGIDPEERKKSQREIDKLLHSSLGANWVNDTTTTVVDLKKSKKNIGLFNYELDKVLNQLNTYNKTENNPMYTNHTDKNKHDVDADGHTNQAHNFLTMKHVKDEVNNPSSDVIEGSKEEVPPGEINVGKWGNPGAIMEPKNEEMTKTMAMEDDDEASYGRSGDDMNTDSLSEPKNADASVRRMKPISLDEDDDTSHGQSQNLSQSTVHPKYSKLTTTKDVDKFSRNGQQQESTELKTKDNSLDVTSVVS